MFKIVSDSSSNLISLEGVSFASVPLHILVGEQSFVDDETLDVNAMFDALSSYNGPSSTSCPSPNDWLNAFESFETVFCVTISSGLSGSYSSACAAKQMYEEAHPDRKVYIFDSLSAGPGLALIIYKIKECIQKGLPAQEIYEKVTAYQRTLHIYYALSSLDNLAKNGRVNPLVAKGIGALGIRVIGTATQEGRIKPIDKARGDKKTMQKVFAHMKANGYQGGRVIISHSDYFSVAQSLETLILDTYPDADISIQENTGLCGYYAEQHSVIVSFEE